MNHRNDIPRITWQGPLLGPSGYAEVGRNVVAGLMKLGVPVRLAPTWGETPLRSFPRREEEGLLEAEIDGHHRYIRLDAPIDSDFRDRILKATFQPAGGVHVMLHPPTNGADLDFYDIFRNNQPVHVARVGYTMFETDRIPESWVACLNRTDEVWVPTTFGRDVFAHCGVDPEKIRVMPLPADPDVYHPGVAPLVIGRPAAFTFLSVFEWTRRKGWDLLLRAFLEEFGPDEDVRLLIRAYQGGGVTARKRPPIPKQYAAFLARHGLSESASRRVEFINRMVPSADMPGLYRAADAFVLPTRGEGWGQPFLETLLTETPVITTRWSAHLDFLDDDVARLIEIDGLVDVDPAQVADNPFYAGHRWAEPSLADLKRQMRWTFEHRDEARRQAALGRARIAERLNPLSVACHVVEAARNLEQRTLHRARAMVTGTERPLNLLFAAREGIFNLPGGDSEVVTSLKKALEARGHRVEFSSHLGDGDGHDLVHVFNLEQRHSLNLALRGVPFVTTPLHEDLDYFDASHRVYRTFQAAIRKGEAGLDELDAVLPLTGAPTPPAPEGGIFAARASDRLLCVGRSEAGRLEAVEPRSRTAIVPLGCRFAADPVEDGDPELFLETYGVRDFVLCVGRLEMRKNQIMLLHALRNVDVPVVFVNSRTHQEDYEEVCRAYPRKAPTIFTGRVSREMLKAAYAAAAVHALPSFFELPGLVTLEAAARGKPVVAGRDGAITDYLPDGVHLCDPCDPVSVREAVLAALSSDSVAAVREAAAAFTWERTARDVEAVYHRILDEAAGEGWKERMEAKRRDAEADFEFQSRIAAVVDAIEGGRYDEAQFRAVHAVEERPADPRGWFVAGEAALKGGDYEAALEALHRSRDLNPQRNFKVYLFAALAEMGLDRPAEAYRVLVDGLESCRMGDGIEALFCDYLARASAALNDRGAERMWTERRVERAPEDPKAALALVRHLLEDREAGEAIRAARRWASNRETGVEPAETAVGPVTGSCRVLSAGLPLRSLIVFGAGAGLEALIAALPAGIPVAVVDKNDACVLEALAAIRDARSLNRSVQILTAPDPAAIRAGLDVVRGRAEVRILIHDRRLAAEPAFFQPLVSAFAISNPSQAVVTGIRPVTRTARAVTPGPNIP